MLSRRDERFPAEPLRDLIGVVRAIRAARAKAGAGRLVLQRIDQVAADLMTAYEMGVSSTPGTLGWRAAWGRAEDAARAVADLVEMTDGAEPILTAARARVGG